MKNVDECNSKIHADNDQLKNEVAQFVALVSIPHPHSATFLRFNHHHTVTSSSPHRQNISLFPCAFDQERTQTIPSL